MVVYLLIEPSLSSQKKKEEEEKIQREEKTEREGESYLWKNIKRRLAWRENK